MKWKTLNKEIKRIFIGEGFITEEDHLFAIKPNFSSFGTIIKNEPCMGWEISFAQDDT